MKTPRTAPNAIDKASDDVEVRGPRRVQLSRAKGWRMPENTKKVDRSSSFGNPFAVGQPYSKHGARTTYVTQSETAVALFRRAIEGELPSDYMHADPQAWKLFAARVKRDLRGKNLACWCPLGQPCHADVLLEIANN